MTTRLTTVAACRVARLDRQRFNEYVSGGDYQCAPATTPGRARLFEEADLIGLFRFAREIEKGVRPFNAGVLACRIIEEIRAKPDSGEVALMSFVNTPAPVFHPVAPGVSAANLTHGPLKVYDVRTFNIATLRQIVKEGIDEERSIVGADDE